MQSINPTNGQLIKEYQADNFSDVEAKLTKLQFNYLTWKEISLDKRIECIKRVAEILEANKLEYALIMTMEMGKLKVQALQEIEKCIKACNYYADNAKQFLAPISITTEASKSYAAYSPLGIIFGIMPWNFPFWQVFRFAIPTLLAGNVILLKHASSVPGCAVAMETIFQEASSDINLELFKIAMIGSDHVDKIISNPLVQAVTLTGSVAAGKSVAATAGANLKKTVLELGGSDPYIVLADADVQHAVNECAKSRLNNCGQSCIAAKRLIIVQDVYDEFLHLLIEYFSKLKIGDPQDDNSNLGPLANKQGFDTIKEQVAKTIQAGATCHIGGTEVKGSGYFYPPTILSNIPPNSPAASEEIFGPVACLFKVPNEKEAIELANSTNFGLGAAVFTRNQAHGEDLAQNHIHAGSVFVNTMVSSDPRMPFGGIKHSGYGRELSSFGIHEFVNIKAIKILDK